MDLITLSLARDYTNKKVNNLKNPLRRGRLMTEFTKFVHWYGLVGQSDEHTTLGETSLKVSTNDEHTTSAGRLRFSNYDLKDVDNIMIRLFVDDITKLSNVQIRFSSVDNMAGYLQWRVSRWQLVEGWNEVMIPLSELTIVGGETFDNPITTIQASVTGASGGQEAIVYFDAMYTNLQQKGSVIFHFDDGWMSQYTNAYPIMRAKGMVGCIGVISNYVGTSNYVNRTQLHELQDYGWEVFNHTVTHSDLSTLTKQEIHDELHGCREWMIENGFVESADIVAYPYGSYSQDVFDVMTNFRFGRSIHEELEIAPLIQPYRVKVFNIFNDTTEQDYQRVIDIAAETGSTVILLFHKIEETGTDSMIFNTDKFTDLVNYVHGKRNELDVLTTHEWLTMGGV